MEETGLANNVVTVQLRRLLSAKVSSVRASVLDLGETEQR
jgi:hypothetical protein